MSMRSVRVEVEKKGTTIIACHVPLDRPHSVSGFFGRSIKTGLHLVKAAIGIMLIAKPMCIEVCTAKIRMKIVPAWRNDGPELVM